MDPSKRGEAIPWWEVIKRMGAAGTGLALMGPSLGWSGIDLRAGDQASTRELNFDGNPSGIQL